MDILNSFKDIQKFILVSPKMNYGYPQISLYLWIFIIHFWISINRFMAIQYSTDLWISKNDFYIYPKMIYGYPKMINGYPKFIYGYP